MLGINAQRARALLESGGHTLALVREEKALSSDLRGVAGLVELIGAGKDLAGFSAADRVVGKAAALLFALAGVEEVYAGVMSRPAALFLKEAGVRFAYGVLVEGIINRAGDGPCPMERAVLGISDPALGLDAILKKQAELRVLAGKRGERK